MARLDIIDPPASGAIDGVNTVFTTAVPFNAGSVQVWLNGQLRRAGDDDGWVELTSTSIELNEPPDPGDDLLIGYEKA